MEKTKIDISNNKSKEKKKNIPSIIFIRACSCLGIVTYHYFEHANGNYKIYFRTANSNIGLLFVTMFFCISGTVHFYNYPKIKSIKIFFYKKWKFILVSYYICNFYFYIAISLISHNLVYKGPWIKLVVNLMGLDGYLLYGYKFNVFNLAGIGEWFLGAIIIIYIIYPILSLLMNINIFIINYIIIINYYIMYKTNFYAKVLYERNFFTCLYSFYFGMLVIKFKRFFMKNTIVLILSLFLSILFFLFQISNTIFLISQLHGFVLYIVLLKVGEFIMNTKYSSIFYTISGLSYSIFLYHHRIIRDILSIYNPIKLNSHLSLLFTTIIIILFFAKMHSNNVDYIIKSKIFVILDRIFLN